MEKDREPAPIIKLANDFILDIATAHSRFARKWSNKAWKWSQIVARCSKTTRTDETLAEYGRMSREEQSGIKDVGGFVGGYLSGGVRKTPNVVNRTIVTLDIDFGTADVWEDFVMENDCAALVYSTHKHTKEAPRLRLMLPASRPMKPSEYEPVCRYWTSRIGIELFDISTYQLPRLFYWPSTSRDGQYYFRYQDGPAFDVDAVLATYRDPQDASQWPLSSRESGAVAHEIRKAGDPTEKAGLIGAFCRAYTIEEAIELLLPDVYEPTANAGRYTYRKGSVAGGCVTYEGHFAYSHHDTDPAGRKLCNAFDLVRIHKFGVYDEGSRVTDAAKLPSYLKMQDFAAADSRTRKLLAEERLRAAGTDFAGIIEAAPAPALEPGELENGEPREPAAEEPDTSWLEHLEYDRKGAIKCTARNIILILDNDPNLKGRLCHDLFSGFDLVTGGLPWDKEATRWGNRDDANLRNYLEEGYGITGKDKIKDARDAILTAHQKHPVRDYLNGLQWDGVPRLDRLIINYLGAEDCRLNREMTRKHFTAAVARVMRPGCKYDYCLILAGPEGIGKSTLLKIMAGPWFNDSLNTMEGKGAMEQLRGSWIIELGELNGIKRSDVGQVKAYISRQCENYRPAYGTVVEQFPRQCIFCGTTNEDFFLKGSTGNRRFWVIKLEPELRKHKNAFADLQELRDQIWAEAVVAYKTGEKLYLDADMEREAKRRQEIFNDDYDDPLKAMLQSFLDMMLPDDWETRSLQRRREFIRNPDPLEAKGTHLRNRVCAAEFICEAMGRDQTDKEFKYLSRRIGGYLANLGWEKVSGSRHVQRLYGVQRAYDRPVDDNDL